MDTTPDALAPESLHEPVLRWYAEHARKLPWRGPGATPWAVMVSEFMLQQTPVTRVLPVFEQWMERWLSPADLVRLTTYLLDPNDRSGYMAARDRFVGSPPPASTLLIVAALADPRYRIEVEAVAARA